MNFSEAEYQRAVSELFDNTTASFEGLCTVADALLRPVVTSWCAATPVLSGRMCEDDIVQEVQLRMIKYVINDFYLRERSDPNRDSHEFRLWLFRVAKNAKNSYIASLCRTATTDITPFEESIAADENECDYEREDASLAIGRAIHSVVALRVGVHKILAWLLVSLIILNEDEKRSSATDKVVLSFADKTLYEMMRAVEREIAKHPFLRLSVHDRESLYEALRENGGGVPVGECRFSSFFTSKGGNYSVSDWIYKINTSIRRSL